MTVNSRCRLKTRDKFSKYDKMDIYQKHTNIAQGNGVLPCVSNRYICGVDYGDSESQGAFTVFKDGKLKWHTQKLWKAKLYLWWMRVKGVIIIRETA